MKKFFALFACLMVIITCSLAGCAGFAVNKVKYYNDILATVGDENITRFELLSAYNSYGYNYYVSQMGQTEEEALNSTLKLLIDREALYQYAKSKDEYKPTPYQINEGIKEMYSSLDEQMQTYVTEAKKILNITESSSEEEEQSQDETAYLRKDYTYTKRAYVVENPTYYTDNTMSTISPTPTSFYKMDYKVEYNLDSLKEPNVYEKVIDESYLTNFNSPEIAKVIKTDYLTKFEQSLTGDHAKEIYNLVIKQLTTSLINYEYYLLDENGKAYNKNNDDLIVRYINRNYQSKLQEIYLENIRTEFLKNEAGSFDVNELSEQFKTMYTTSRNKYINKPDNYKNDMKNIGTNADTILYHNNLADDTKFGYFIHTLLSFDDETKQKITDLDKLKDYISQDEYDTRYAEIVSTPKISYRDEDGKTVEEKVSLSAVMDEYLQILNIVDYQTKMDAFIDFMFKYSGDTATLSQGMPYVVGNNGNSAMEEAFTNECVRLMDLSEGSMSTDASCITSYGIHLVFYVGRVDKFDLKNPLESYVASGNLDNNPNNLYTSIINPLTGKTYFDLIFDKVYPTSGSEVYTSNTGYSDHEQALINQIKVTKYTDKIKNTTTKI